MPFYEYECQACKFYTEVMQKISDAPLARCPSCGKRTLKKLLSAPVFRLKGAGWYETDFKSAQENKRNLVGADKEESKPDVKAQATDGKPAAPEAKDSKPADAKPAESKPAPPKTAAAGGAAPARNRVSVAASRAVRRGPQADPGSKPRARAGGGASHERRRQKWNVRRYLVAGVLVWLPIVATIWVVSFMLHIMDRTLLLLPPAYRPEALVGFSLPGVGALFALIVLLLTGLLVTNLIGRAPGRLGRGPAHRIPLVRTVYGGVKSFTESVFSQSNSFRQVVMVEYPRAGTWSIGFLTAEDVPEISDKMVSRTRRCISQQRSMPPPATW